MMNSKMKWIVWTIVVFIVGSALGFVGGQAYQRHARRMAQANRQSPEQNIINNLKKELNLTDTQTETIKGILEENRKKIQAEFAPIRQKVRSIREEVDKQIENVLTTEQKPKFAELRKKEERDNSHRWGRDTTSFPHDTTSRDTTGKITVSKNTTNKREK